MYSNHFLILLPLIGVAFGSPLAKNHFKETSIKPINQEINRPASAYFQRMTQVLQFGISPEEFDEHIKKHTKTQQAEQPHEITSVGKLSFGQQIDQASSDILNGKYPSALKIWEQLKREHPDSWIADYNTECLNHIQKHKNTRQFDLEDDSSLERFDFLVPGYYSSDEATQIYSEDSVVKMQLERVVRYLSTVPSGDYIGKLTRDSLGKHKSPDGAAHVLFSDLFSESEGISNVNNGYCPLWVSQPLQYHQSNLSDPIVPDVIVRYNPNRQINLQK